MKPTKAILSSLVLHLVALVLFFFPLSAPAHPMDIGSLNIRLIDENRLEFALRLHVLAASTLAKTPNPAATDADLLALENPLFDATLATSIPRLGNVDCSWRKPTLAFDGNERQFVELKNIAACTGAKPYPFVFELALPFLRYAPPKFELLTRIESGGEPFSILANAAKPEIKIGEDNKPDRSFFGFIVTGMGHIGALPREWVSNAGTLQVPEGLDHICFVLALIVAGGSLTGLLKNVTGFTIGHSLTLGLSAFQIIHVHSSWVESLIALSIAYVAGASLFRPLAPHRWLVATLFGTVHGLGFASVLHELDMSPSEILPALLGFNIGVEAGQIVIIAATLPLLLLIKRQSPGASKWTNHSLAMVLLVVGSYWFYQRITAG